jgi:hypothetical protein
MLAISLMSLLNPFHAEHLIKYPPPLGIFHINMFALLKPQVVKFNYPQMAEEVHFTDHTNTKLIQTKKFISEQNILHVAWNWLNWI